MTRLRSGALVLTVSVLAVALPAAPATRPEDEARVPWDRSDAWFVKTWIVAGPFAEPLDQDPPASQGGEAALAGRAGAELKRTDGTVVRWKESTSWSDAGGTVLRKAGRRLAISREAVRGSRGRRARCGT